MKALYLVDAHCIIHRNYHRPGANLTDPGGEPTKATHGFFRAMVDLCNNSAHKITHISVCFDSNKKKLLKRKIDPEYKMGRKETTDELRVQIKRCLELSKAMGLNPVKIAGYEADDLMATLVHKFQDQVDVTVIVSSDKDMLQLANSSVEVHDPFDNYTLSQADIIKKWGVTSDKVLEVMTLCGDSTDNVDGCSGIGPPTAAKLIKRFGTAKKVAKSTRLLTPGLRKAIESADLNRTRELMRLLTDAPIVADLSDFSAPESIFNDDVRMLLRMLGFRR